MSKQSDLIGNHPLPPNQFGRWLSCNDIAVTPKKCHRALKSALPNIDTNLIEWLARKLIQHHYDDFRIEKLKEKYAQAGFPLYAEQFRKLPRAEKVQKGNTAEILLIEYVEGCRGKEGIKVFKFRYNPNVDQAMKGDDMLVAEFMDDKKEQLKLFLGEAKFRSTPDKSVVEDIMGALSEDKKPLSYTFLIDQLAKDKATESLAEKLENFMIDDIKGAGNIIYTGFLLSNKDAQKTVEGHLSSDNPSFVFISTSIDNPSVLVAKAFEKANQLISAPIGI